MCVVTNIMNIHIYVPGPAIQHQSDAHAACDVFLGGGGDPRGVYTFTASRTFYTQS